VPKGLLAELVKAELGACDGLNGLACTPEELLNAE
jgi:hypothetical protein